MMKEIDLSKEQKLLVLKEIVHKFLPNKTFIYDDPNFLIIDPDKRFGFSKTGFRLNYLRGMFKKKNIQRFGSPTRIKELLSGSSDYFIGVSETSFQENDFKVLEKLYEIYVEYFNKLEKIKQGIVDKQQRLKEEKRLKELKVSKTNVLSKLDKDGNGEVDVVEGNDFNTLLKKHQKSIIELDRNYVQQFVKVSSYLKTKKQNIQSIFNSIKDIPNQEVLKEYVEILEDEIHTYNLVLINSLRMIVFLVEDDMITFYEIHEMFDTLNMFDSKHEKDVSQKLTNIGDGLKDLMYEVRRMGNNISNSIQELSSVTEESNNQLKEQLSGINSTLKVGNFINTINTHQNYKTNRKLNS